MLFENKIQFQKADFGEVLIKAQNINKKKKIEKVQAHDRQHDFYYADLFPKKLCLTALFNNPTCANWQKATDIFF